VDTVEPDYGPWNIEIESAIGFIEDVKRNHEKDWTEVSKVIEIVERMGFGSYKLTGDPQDPIFMHYEIS